MPDTRIMSHVPLPLPAPAPAADVASRNKQLIAEIRSSLSADEFDSFRIQSSAYRMGDLSASVYLQFFYGLMRGHENEGRVEQLLMELIALLPDETKRKELHAEYAKHKVWEKIAKMKGGKDGAKMEVLAKAGGDGGGHGVDSFQGVPVRELKRPVVDGEERTRGEREDRQGREGEGAGEEERGAKESRRAGQSRQAREAETAERREIERGGRQREEGERTQREGGQNETRRGRQASGRRDGSRRSSRTRRKKLIAPVNSSSCSMVR